MIPLWSLYMGLSAELIKEEMREEGNREGEGRPEGEGRGSWPRRGTCLTSPECLDSTPVLV